VGEPFYHLDTCLAVLDEDSVLLHPPAFRAEALDRLARLFPRLIEADASEAREHLPATRTRCRRARARARLCSCRRRPSGTAARLAAEGFAPQAVDVDEFHKSGGSIFCLKMELAADETRTAPSTSR
jgi:N-dimethylarginine dimethylaminohydrolase